MDKKIRLEITKEAKRIEEDSLHSARGHFEEAARWDRIRFWMGLANASIAAIAGASILSEKFPVLGGILALVVSMLTAVNTFSNPNKKTVNHLNAGNYYNSLRNNARLFYGINLVLIKDEKQILGDLKQLNDERNKLNQNSPIISRWAYERGKKGIERGEALHQVDS